MAALTRRISCLPVGLGVVSRHSPFAPNCRKADGGTRPDWLRNCRARDSSQPSLSLIGIFGFDATLNFLVLLLGPTGQSPV